MSGQKITHCDNLAHVSPLMQQNDAPRGLQKPEKHIKHVTVYKWEHDFDNYGKKGRRQYKCNNSAHPDGLLLLWKK